MSLDDDELPVIGKISIFFFSNFLYCLFYVNSALLRQSYNASVSIKLILHTKLYGPVPELEKTVAFIAQAGIGI